MGYKVALSRTAEFDRDAILRYLVQKDTTLEAASRFMNAFDLALDRLSANPWLFAGVRDDALLRRGYRKILFGRYVALFTIESDVVRIARIFHQRQNYASLL